LKLIFKAMYLPEDIDDILQRSVEGEALEFKSAESNFDSRERSDYCAAIANMGGGKLLLGVNNDRVVVGTAVYQGTINTIPQEVYQTIGLTIAVEEVQHPNGRVVIFDIPPRPVGQRVRSNGHYLYPVRRGESLGEMDDALTRKILNEVQPDFSSVIVDDLAINGLDENAVMNFRRRRSEKTGNDGLLSAPIEQVLSDVSLARDGKLTNACLLLLGKTEKINSFLSQAEIIYEWRNNPEQIHHDFRIAWRAPYFSIYDEIWRTINARNIRVPYQEGFIQNEVMAFDEKACREAVNNAVAHRNYSLGGRSILIKASPSALSVVSPGGFPDEITPENVLSAAPSWRNRLIAEAFEATKLVERSGQGMDNIFETSIRQGKGLPNFIGTSGNTVQINIPATVQDVEFVKFLEKVANEKQVHFPFDEIFELEKLREKKISQNLQHKEKFLKLGIIEKVGKTSGTKFILSHRYYSHEEKPGIYTRIKGFNREAKKNLILEHIRREGAGRREDFIDAFPELKPQDITNLLSELKRDNKIKRVGSDRAGHWVSKDSQN